MAIVNLAEHKTTEVSGKIPPYFQKLCHIRILGAKFEVSETSGKPRIDLKCELINPLEHKVGGIEYKDLNKNPFKIMLMLDAEKGLKNTAAFHEKLELPMEIDPENPNLSIYEGVVFKAIMESREEFFKSYDREAKAEIFVLDGAGKKISKGFSWNLSSINSMTIANIQGRDTGDWSHVPEGSKE